MISLLKKLCFYFIKGLILLESRASGYIGTALMLGVRHCNQFIITNHYESVMLLYQLTEQDNTRQNQSLIIFGKSSCMESDR